MEQGHEVAIFPFPERIWGSPVVFGVSPGQVAKVFPTMTFPGKQMALRDSWRWFVPSARAGLTLRDLLHMAGLRAAIAKLKPHIVHVHDPSSDFPRLYQLAGASKPLFLTHNTPNTGANLEAYKRILFTSELLRNGMMAGRGLPAERARVIHLPLDKDFQYENVASSLARSGLAVVAGMVPAKRIELLIEAYRMRPAIHQHPLRVCDVGSDEVNLPRPVTEDGLQITFEGHLEADGFRRQVGSARFLVLLGKEEGINRAMTEALAKGTPIIGWAPLVKEMEACLGVRVGLGFAEGIPSANELGQTIQSALKEYGENVFSHEAIAIRAREEFSLSRYGKRILNSYTEAKEQE
jgi:glycosyltransferase involved in cell wall biosynthesis